MTRFISELTIKVKHQSKRQDGSLPVHSSLSILIAMDANSERETAFFQVFLNLIQLQKGIQQRQIPLPKEIRKAYVLLETEEPTAT